MARRITRYETHDGLIHETLSKAHEHEHAAACDELAQASMNALNGQHTRSEQIYWITAMLPDRMSALHLRDRLNDIFGRDDQDHDD